LVQSLFEVSRYFEKVIYSSLISTIDFAVYIRTINLYPSTEIMIHVLHHVYMTTALPLSAALYANLNFPLQSKATCQRFKVFTIVHTVVLVVINSIHY